MSAPSRAPGRRSAGAWLAFSLPVAGAACLLAAGVWAQDAPDAGARMLVGSRGSAIVARSVSGRRAALASGAPVALRTGFIPDPLVVRGAVLTERSLAALGEGCAGVASRAPTQRVRMETRFGFLRVFATGRDDLTLAVRTEDGAVLCSDDRFGRHPSVEGRFAAGTLDIWVGVKEDTVVAPEPGPDEEIDHSFELELTETRSIRPGVRSGEDDDRLSLAVEAGLDVRPETGRDGDLRLRRGFLPDPRFLEGATAPSGEHVDVGGLADTCRGFVAAAPSHVLTLQDDLDFFQVYVVEAPESTTIVVLGPDGSVSCDTDDGDHPHVTRDAWPQGTYRIWVGAHRADAAFPYRLGLSEIRRTR